VKKHRQKMIAPIVITLVLLAYDVLYFQVIIHVMDGADKIWFGILPVLSTLLMFYVTIQRILEIRGGEEDDLSKY
jgi:hypothetical protein